MKFVALSLSLILIFGQTVTATWNKGCGGGCSSPCSGNYDCGDSAPLLETSGCAGGACVSSGGGGYHTKKTTTVVKEERNDEVSLVIGGGSQRSIRKHYVQPEVHQSDAYVQEHQQPVEVIKKKTYITHSAPQIRTWVEPIGTIVKKKTTYIDAPAPIVHQSHRSHHESYVEEPSVDTVVTKRKTTYVSAPVSEVSGYTRETYVQPVQPVITRKTTYITSPVVHKTTVYKEPIVVHKHRYVESAPLVENDCSGPCGGSKLVKIIKKTTYNDEGDSCPACGGGGGSSYSSRYESYPGPETVVHKKVTKIITSGPSYSSGGCYGDGCGRSSRITHTSECPGGECGGYGSSGKSGAYAFASSSSSASSGSYSGGGGGRGGCKTGCDQWRK